MKKDPELPESRTINTNEKQGLKLVRESDQNDESTVDAVLDGLRPHHFKWMLAKEVDCPINFLTLED